MRFDSILLHGKLKRSYAGGATLPPISQVNAFRYNSAEELEAVFNHKSSGFAYTRIGNPSINEFELRVQELEGGVGAVATSSGMAAITNTILNITASGEEIIMAKELYGGTIDLIKDLEKLGISVKRVDSLTREAVQPLINDKTRLIFGEFVSNPSQKVVNIPEISAVAHENGIPLVIDATTVTPYSANPLKLGADIVIHSSSKYINGSGDAISGIIVYGGKFKWDFDKFTALSEFRKFGPMAFLVRLRTDLWENMGSCLAPMNAYLNVIGIETLALRMERINKNAAKLASALESEDVEVNHLSLETHPYHYLCEELLGGNGGGIMTIRAGSKEKAYSIINNLKIPCIASNIGDVRTLVLHPASTIFNECSVEEREAAGVYDDTIRISVGIEDADDLIEDFIQAINISNGGKEE